MVVIMVHVRKNMVNVVLLDGGFEGKCYNKWIKVEVRVIATLASSIQPTNG
jgi:hypothetical protein